MNLKLKNEYKNNIHLLSRAVIIDQGHILLCHTLCLPLNFYFLPGGHIEPGESAKSALLRELLEETGTSGTIKRFLGCLEYSFEPDQNSNICHFHEYSFIFEVEVPTLKAKHKTLAQEPHIELIWLPLDQLESIDFRAAPLKTLIPQWLQAPVTETFQSVMND